MIASLAAYLFLGALVVLMYVWPACARLWRPFAFSMGVAMISLVAFWLSAYVGPLAMEEPRGLGATIGIALRVLATGYLIMACAVQGVRLWADSSGLTGYRHWPVVLIGILPPPLVGVAFV